MKHGQSTLEFALIAPFVIGLLALVLEGGLLISDQVNLQQYAAAGAQFATARGGNETIADIQNYVLDQMCGQHSTIPSSSGSKFCRAAPAGVPQLNLGSSPPLVSVTVGTTPVTSVRPLDLLLPGPPINALAVAPSPDCTAPNAKWGLDSSATPIVLYAGGVGGPSTSTVTVTFSANPPLGPSPAAPIVRLSGGPFQPPGFLSGPSGGTPLFTPPTISPTGSFATTSTLTLYAPAGAPAGIYTIPITGVDQNGCGPSKGSHTVTITVISGTPTPTPPTNAVRAITVSSPLVCSNTATVENLTGANFASGMTVSVGGTPATAVSVVNAGLMTFTTPVLVNGVYDVTVNNPTGGSVATIVGAITVSASCTVTPLPGPTSTACASSGGVNSAGTAAQAVITISWNEPLALPTLTNQGYFTLSATEVVLCQSPTRPSPSP